MNPLSYPAKALRWYREREKREKERAAALERLKSRLIILECAFESVGLLADGMSTPVGREKWNRFLDTIDRYRAEVAKFPIESGKA